MPGAGSAVLWHSPFTAPLAQEVAAGIWPTLASLLLVGIAMALSQLNDLGLAKDMAVSIARAFLQLTIIGLLLTVIFAQDGWRGALLIFAAFCFMVTTAGLTAAQRAKGVPHARKIVWGSIFIGTSVSMFLLVALRVFEPTPRFLIPVAGMMVGNAMNNCSVALKRLREDMRDSLQLIEAALALGATPRQAVQTQIKRALVLALTPVLDQMKTMGLISLPGAMTGMIMGGASPVDATKLQMIVATFLIGTSTLSCMLSVFMAWPCFFTPAFQLKHELLQAA